MTFQKLLLDDSLLRAVADEGYTTPTPIQISAIPQVLAGHDVLGCAQTGTGKTAAFALPILHQLIQHQPQLNSYGKRPIRTLILAPTRELAGQIAESFSTYGKHTRVRHTVIYGGVNQNSQVSALRNGVDVLIATPGRLLDLMNQGFVDLSHLMHFVLDEADNMLDMGFIHDIRKIIPKIPAKRQTLLFSATMPSEIRELANTILHDPVSVHVARISSTVETVQQSLYYVAKEDKPAMLLHYIKANSPQRALVFTRTKHGADRVVKQLIREGVQAIAIHGNKSMNARKRAMDNFKSDKPPVLIATDIAARGIDIDDVSHVFNYDLPNVPETYVHRIGRTARAGASGLAVSFCDHEERTYLRDIERLIKQTIPVEPTPKELPQPRPNPQIHAHTYRVDARAPQGPSGQRRTPHVNDSRPMAHSASAAAPSHLSTAHPHAPVGYPRPVTGHPHYTPVAQQPAGANRSGSQHPQAGHRVAGAHGSHQRGANGARGSSDASGPSRSPRSGGGGVIRQNGPKSGGPKSGGRSAGRFHK